jgi:hypothetical protein
MLDGFGRSGKLMLVLASTVNLGFGSLRDSCPYFCFSKTVTRSRSKNYLPKRQLFSLRVVGLTASMFKLHILPNYI